MTSLVNYELNESVATITLDDGKVNVLGPAMQTAINEALDRAEADDAKAVVLAGNSRVFSGGFDLAVFQSGRRRQAALAMLAGGFELSVRCADVSQAGHHGRDGPGDRDGLVPAAQRRPPGRRPEVAVPGHRGGDRHDDSDLGRSRSCGCG